MSTSDFTSWQRGPGPDTLARGECHVWRLRLDRAANLQRETCHRTLRKLLGRYTGVAPERVQLVDGPFGKPQMRDGAIQFNVSHSGGVGLVALAAGISVGVDVEEMKGDLALDTIAQDFFSVSERDLLRGLSGEAHLAAFYRAWTRREATIKARGASITRPLREQGVDGRWHVDDLPVGEGYAAALCVEGPGVPVSLWEGP
jgi:4'-phosphopantetheinyl transferase